MSGPRCKHPRRYAFVVPRFGEQIAGGAETLVAHLARRLAARGDHIEIFTTCALDNRTWSNEFPAGTVSLFGMQVWRFPVDARDLEAWVPRQIKIAEGMQLGVEEELTWMEQGVSSKALYAHIREVAHSFDQLFFAPYLFGTTFWGSLVCPEKSCLIPCLHDESYAYAEVIQSMFRQVQKCLFNAAPEQELASSIYGNLAGGEVGMGFEPLSESFIEQLSPYFSDPFPYVLYVGRKETGKNLQILIDYFLLYRERFPQSELRLVIVGGGDLRDAERPLALQHPYIVDLEQLSESDKQRVIKHATVLCQPSTNESFSIVLMEAWQLGVPVLVHSACAVTRHHVITSGGGLYFSSSDDFISVVECLHGDPGLRQQLASAGKSYVASYYSWEAVLERFDRVVDSFGDHDRGVVRSTRSTVARS